jgi:hypothetical protein
VVDSLQVFRTSDFIHHRAASSQLHRRQRREMIMRYILSNHVLHVEFGDLHRHNYVRSVIMCNLNHCNRSIYYL